MNLVDAQQARRMLDRMVGYTISPLLWAKVKRGLSAGRVQSVALRIICDREDEINAFIPEEYWSLEGDFQVKGEKKPLQAKFYGTDKKMDIHSKEEMDKLLASLKDKEYEINEVKKGERIKKWNGRWDLLSAYRFHQNLRGSRCCCKRIYHCSVRRGLCFKV